MEILSHAGLQCLGGFHLIFSSLEEVNLQEENTEKLASKPGTTERYSRSFTYGLQ